MRSRSRRPGRPRRPGQQPVDSSCPGRAGQQPVNDLVTHLARFSGALRDAGIAVTLGDEIDAADSLAHIDIGDRAEVRLALRTSLKVEPRAWPLFDHVFEDFWCTEGGRHHGREGRGRPRRRRQQAPRTWPGQDNPLAELAQTIAERGRVGPVDPANDPARDGGRPGYSPRVLLRRKSFEQCSADELAAMERLLAQVARKLAARPSRRLVPSPRGRAIDLRRSFRRALARDGEFLDLARRDRAVELPRIVFICDTSGSMDPYARFALAFILSLGKVARRTEIFVLNTSLTRLTPWIAAGSVAATLGRFARRVEDWSGGTRLGECLTEFADDHLRRTVAGDTSVLIFSDGLDRGDTGALATALLAIRRRARRVIWLNPLMGDPRYRPEARGMRAALPHVDHLVPAHNLESLEKLVDLL